MNGGKIVFIDISFLPESRVTHVIVDKNSPDEFLANLEKLRITYFLSGEVGAMPSVATHPDMQIFNLGGNKIVCEPSVHKYFQEYLSPLGFNVICGRTLVSGNYPYDIAYNIARVGGLAIHKTSHTDTEILSLLKEFNVGIINVSQGYTKCAIAIISQKAVITADNGIAKALSKADIDVLLIKAGSITLKGMEYGFIGGTCGLIAKNLLAFCGNIEKHPEYERIKAFAKKHSVDIISRCSGGLIDIGSIIPIKQEVMDWSSSQ